MVLTPGFEALARQLQEASTSLSHDDIRSRVSKALSDKHTGGDYAYPVDIFGDDESGDVVYGGSKGMRRAKYTMGSANGNPTCDVDCEGSEAVMPRTVYDTPADDDDHMLSMEAQGLYEKGAARIAERFISKDERDKADAGDFAGKGKSFPILKPEDVGAAVHAMGRAGRNNLGPSGIKARIIAIAKRKGWTSSLPKSWQDGGGDAKEARKPEQALESAPIHNFNIYGALSPRETIRKIADLQKQQQESAPIEITGDVVALREGAVGQDGTAHLKLIAPGWGSSGYYSPELLERDGPKAFKAGTKSFWNHQTEAEEAARPEGDLRDLASVLTEDAKYMKNGPAGPGLYAKAKVFEQFRQPVDDLAKHIGMSIRASGKAKEGKAEGRTGPIIEELTRGISVDYVTTPGAGGKILQLFEAARAAKPTELKEAATDMDAAEIKKLQEGQAELVAENRKLRERFALTDAATEARKYFTTVQVAEAVKERVLGRVLAGSIPLTEAGDLDAAKLTAIVEHETKDELAYIGKLSGGRIVTDMGAGNGAAPQLTEAQIAEAKKADEAAAQRNASFIGLQTSAGRKIFTEGAGSFDPTYNARERKLQEVTQ